MLKEYAKPEVARVNLVPPEATLCTCKGYEWPWVEGPAKLNRCWATTEGLCITSQS
jgi:hypothetical protein